MLGVAVRHGRLFTPGDTADAERVAIVDEAFVARHLADGPGARAGGSASATRSPPWMTIVGVVPSLVQAQRAMASVRVVARSRTRSSNRSTCPLRRLPRRSVTILARTGDDPLAVTSGVRSALAAVSAGHRVTNANSLAGELWRRGWAFRLFGGLFLMFGAAALVLAAAGLYGVMAFTVRRRTQEIGVRMALGASRRSMLRMVLWQGLWRVGVSASRSASGRAGSSPRRCASCSRMSRASDPVVHVTTALTLLVSGAIASLVPALRASSVDPLTALRRD